eukprot:317549-Chlamydomonas_euryale.AAC.1
MCGGCARMRSHVWWVRSHALTCVVGALTCACAGVVSTAVAARPPVSHARRVPGIPGRARRHQGGLAGAAAGHDHVPPGAARRRPMSRRQPRNDLCIDGAGRGLRGSQHTPLVGAFGVAAVAGQI